MNLDFSDDQKFLQNEARKFLEKEESVKRSRGVLEASETFDNDLWQKIIELGWTGIRIPEEYDGLGLGHLELCVIAEELGRHLAPVPFSSSVYLFTEAIIKYGSEELKKEILPKLVTGKVVGTIAVTEDFLAPTSNNIKTEVSNEFISGTKIAVPDCEAATHSIIVCKSSDNLLISSCDSSGLLNLPSNAVLSNSNDRIFDSKFLYSFCSL